MDEKINLREENDAVSAFMKMVDELSVRQCRALFGAPKPVPLRPFDDSAKIQQRAWEINQERIIRKPGEKELFKKFNAAIAKINPNAKIPVLNAELKALVLEALTIAFENANKVSNDQEKKKIIEKTRAVSPGFANKEKNNAAMREAIVENINQPYFQPEEKKEEKATKEISKSSNLSAEELAELDAFLNAPVLGEEELATEAGKSNNFSAEELAELDAFLAEPVLGEETPKEEPQKEEVQKEEADNSTVLSAEEVAELAALSREFLGIKPEEHNETTDSSVTLLVDEHKGRDERWEKVPDEMRKAEAKTSLDTKLTASASTVSTASKPIDESAITITPPPVKKHPRAKSEGTIHDFIDKREKNIMQSVKVLGYHAMEAVDGNTRRLHHEKGTHIDIASDGSMKTSGISAKNDPKEVAKNLAKAAIAMMIVLSDLSRRYGKELAFPNGLQNIEMTIPAGPHAKEIRAEAERLIKHYLGQNAFNNIRDKVTFEGKPLQTSKEIAKEQKVHARQEKQIKQEKAQPMRAAPSRLRPGR